MSFEPENEARRGARGRTSGRPSADGLWTERATTGEERRRGRPVGRPERRLVLLAVGLLLLALVAGALLLRLSYGDRVGGTSVFEDSVDSGSEPVVRLTNGPGQVRIEGSKGLETVEISAKRYARGSSSAAAKDNAATVPVNVDNGSSALEISSEGGGGVGVDYDLKVPPGSTVEVESAAGDVEVSGLDNDATVRAEAGDVSVNNVRGSVTIDAPQGDVALKSSGTETGRAEIQIGAGDLSLEDVVFGILESQVEAGGATLSGRFSGSGSIFVQTGNISVRLPPEDARELDLQTRVGEVVREDEQKSG